MSKLRCHISISLDGYVAGPNQSVENPLGEGGEQLHDWVVPLASWREGHDKEGGEVNASGRVVEEVRENIGAAVMGRNMFGPIGGGPWVDEDWKGWWGDNPPYHYPVFVVTHHRRDPVEMAGGTTYHFVTDGIESAFAQARRRPVGRTSCCGAVGTSSGSTSRRVSWTNSSCMSYRYCWVVALGSSAMSAECGSNSSGRSRRLVSPTSSTAS
jgi:dihydrofolate reductase